MMIDVWKLLLDFIMGVYSSIYGFFNSSLFWDWLGLTVSFDYYDIVEQQTMSVDLSVATLMLGSGIIVMLGVWIWKWVKQIIL